VNKFSYKLGKTATWAHEMLVQVYGTEAVSRKCVYDWFKRFRDGKETTEDEPRSGRPSTSRTPDKIERVRQMLAEDRRETIRWQRNWALQGHGAHNRPRRFGQAEDLFPVCEAQADRRTESKRDGNFWRFHYHV